MKFLNRFEASKQLGVSYNTITDWAKQGRIRASGWMKNQPVFAQSAIDEVKEELKKYDRPAVKDDDVEPVPS